MTPTLLALAGLPGTGKSRLARALAARLGWPVLDKDELRARLFGAGVDHTTAQDDRAMAALYDAAAARLAAGARGVIVDGRTFTRRAAVEALVAAAARAGARLAVVECRCAPELARERLARDAAAGAHPAANRGPALHDRLAAQADPLALPAHVPHLVVDTGDGATGAHVRAVLAALDLRRGPSARVKWAVTLLAPPAALLALELGLRLGGFSQPPIPVPIIAWTTEADARLRLDDQLHRPDPLLLWTPRPGALVMDGHDERINAATCRGPPPAPDRPAGSLRVALLGESSLFGMFVPWEQTAGARLPALLAGRGPPVDVLNAAVIGYTACQGVLRYRTVAREHRPDVVFAAFGAVNEHVPCIDLPEVEKLAAARALHSGWSRAWVALSSHVRVLQLVNRLRLREDGARLEQALSGWREHRSDGLAQVGRVDWPGRRRVSLDEFEAALLELARDVRADGARLVLGSLPRAERVERRGPVLALYSQRVRDVAAREGLQLLDLRAIVREEVARGRDEQDVFVPGDAWHLGPEGQALLAAHLAELVLDPQAGRVGGPAAPR